MPTHIHNSFIHFYASHLFPAIQSWLQNLLSDGFHTYIVLNSTTKLQVDSKVIGKEPDAGLQLWGPVDNLKERLYPSLVIECGYRETWAKLKRDASAWLWGSKRQVQCVILAKFHKPANKKHFSDETKWVGYLEIHRRESQYVKFATFLLDCKKCIAP